MHTHARAQAPRMHVQERKKRINAIYTYLLSLATPIRGAAPSILNKIFIRIKIFICIKIYLLNIM